LAWLSYFHNIERTLQPCTLLAKCELFQLISILIIFSFNAKFIYMIEWNLTYGVYIGIKLAKFDDDNLVLIYLIYSTIFANNIH
jgi:hypothetical protein